MAECHWASIVQELIGHPIKEQQQDVMQKLLNKQHVFACFPTGFGKSVLFGAFPAVYQHLHPEEKEAPIALVISPLNSLSANHVLSWNEKGVPSVVLKPLADMDDETVEGVKKGTFSLIFASPEIVQQDHWWAVLKDLRTRVKLLVIDEAHTLSIWGPVFREEFLKVGNLRGILKSAVTLALTATATNELVRDVCSKLGLQDRMTVVSLSPDRPEIFLEIQDGRHDMVERLSWYGDIIKEKQELAPRAIIYSRTICTVINIWHWLDGYVGAQNIMVGAEDELEGRFVEMFHGSTDTESQQRIVTNFRKPHHPLRCVVATIAFGLGVDIPNIRYVLHWGPSKDVLSYWQECGRCSRDGQQGKAITYTWTGAADDKTKKCMKSVLSSSSDTTVCLRASVLSHMDVSGQHTTQQHANCCYNCRQNLS